VIIQNHAVKYIVKLAVFDNATEAAAHKVVRYALIKLLHVALPIPFQLGHGTHKAMHTLNAEVQTLALDASHAVIHK
jgi:hypothetical protein